MVIKEEITLVHFLFLVYPCSFSFNRPLFSLKLSTKRLINQFCKLKLYLFFVEIMKYYLFLLILNEGCICFRDKLGNVSRFAHTMYQPYLFRMLRKQGIVYQYGYMFIIYCSTKVPFIITIHRKAYRGQLTRCKVL